MSGIANVTTAAALGSRVSAGLAGFRRWLAKHPRVAASSRALRALVHFGPWRGGFRLAIRAARPPLADAGVRASILPPLDVCSVVQALSNQGVYVAGQIAPEVLARLRCVADALPLHAYTHAHEADTDIQAIVSDPTVLAVLRAHFRSEPVLLECSLVVHEPGRLDELEPLSQRRFHFDYAGWQSLNLFVYLTDVNAESGPHEVVLGTHRQRTWRDAVRPSLSDEEAFTRFGSMIKTITGPAGTVFFEDTEAFHRRGAVLHRRVLLNVLYASHRGIFSHGRPGLRYADFLARQRSS